MKAATNFTHVEEEGEQGHGHVDGVHHSPFQGHHDLTAGRGCQIRFLLFFI